jgi:hypothetical protein
MVAFEQRHIPLDLPPEAFIVVTLGAPIGAKKYRKLNFRLACKHPKKRSLVLNHVRS